jgi:hypothetical protein
MTPPIPDDPCEPGLTSPGSEDARRSSLGQPSLSLLQSLAILIWISALAGSIWLSWNRSFLFAATTGTICISAIPLLAAGSWQKRITASLVMPFIGLGLVGGVALYFALFAFRWFENVFNNPGFFPLGFVVFAFSFSMAGGYVGYRCVSLASRLLARGRTKS